MDLARCSSPETSFPKSSIKVLLLENVHQQAVKAFKDEGFQVIEHAKSLSEDELCKAIKDVHLIGLRSKTKLTDEVLSCARRLLAIGCFCIGTDQVSLDTARRRGIPVFNSPYANSRSVAEMTISNMVALARQIGDRNRELHNGVWNKVSKGCYELRGKTLGIVGYGHVGSQLSVLAESFGMRVVYRDVKRIMPLGNARQVDTLEELLQTANFVSLHVPDLSSTRGLIKASEIDLMPASSYLINAARGKVVDLDALATALKAGKIAGAAVDVYPSEPRANGPGFESPLIGCPNTILTPHIGGSTEEAQRSIGLEVSSKLVSFVNIGSTGGAVNFPSVDLTPNETHHRILSVHNNVPGVMRRFNDILADYNIEETTLRTHGNISYLVIDLNNEASLEVMNKIKKDPDSIVTRVLF